MQNLVVSRYYFAEDGYKMYKYLQCTSTAIFLLFFVSVLVAVAVVFRLRSLISSDRKLDFSCDFIPKLQEAHNLSE